SRGCGGSRHGGQRADQPAPPSSIVPHRVTTSSFVPCRPVIAAGRYGAAVITSWPSGYVSTRAPGAWSRQWVDSLCPVAAAATQHTNRRKSTTGAVQLSDARRAAVHPRTGAVGRVGPHAGRAAGRRAADYAAVRARASRYPG